MVTKATKLPSFEELETTEINLSSATLMAAAPFLGTYCEKVNNEFMLCRAENNDPRPCVDLGKQVTECSMEFFMRVKKDCLHEHDQYVNCLDKSSGNYQPWFCRKTQAVYQKCVEDNLCIKHPGFGYFTRGRVHKSSRKAPPPPPRPCLPKDGDETPRLPDSAPRREARFGSRLYWMTE